MATVVKKFGGTSVGTIERIQKIAELALAAHSDGQNVVLVVSAMSGETNRLVGLAHQINPIPYSIEYDMLLASGEQVAASLVSLAINTLKPKSARPLLGHQIGIWTDNVFSKARIQEIDTRLIRKTLSEGMIPVIAGFQGVDSEMNITTLGRGGSDTSAVAIAAALEADDCEIFTDVDGVYTTDPRICSKARKMDVVSYEEMMELASLGAKVLQIRSVEIAAKFKVPLHVCSSFNLVEGTRVVSREFMKQKGLEEMVVVGIAADANQVQFNLQNVPELATVFKALSDDSIVVDVITQSLDQVGKMQVSFTLGQTDALKARKILEDLKKVGARDLQIQEAPDLAKVSIVGVGMQHHPGVASKMFDILARNKIAIHLVSTSEIKVSCLIPQSEVKNAVTALHTGFELDL